MNNFSHLTVSPVGIVTDITGNPREETNFNLSIISCATKEWLAPILNNIVTGQG